ncbi:MAG TPA: 3'-5' exonuclease [Gammaproteobacteria bacterium]|nr:3'-5' exonuclease [Gammaproteobacteria bacterium]
MSIFVFDIETIPDTQLGRRLLNIEANDRETADAMLLLQRQTQGSDFPKHHLHRIVAISCVFRHRDSLKIWSLGEETSDEKTLIERFFSGITKFIPTLVSWNGTGFDLPVLHYRALMHAIPSSVYWETGDFDSNFRWNNYLNRYHTRHIDLMDTLSAFQPRAFAPLHEMALALGLPGKMGMDGREVWNAYQAGEIQRIRNYCEIDVINTYLIFLRFEFIRGRLNTEEYLLEQQKLRDHLENEKHEHFQAFLKVWNETYRNE